MIQSGSINPIKDGRKCKSIISISIFMMTLKIVDSFLMQKVNFLCFLINNLQDMRVKLIFAFTTLAISLYLSIYIHHFSFLLTFKLTKVVGR